MGKNTQKYKYLDVGLEWDSWTLAQLEKDAKHHQMADLPAKMVGIRLTEYYMLVEQGIIIPGLAMTRGSTAPPQRQTIPKEDVPSDRNNGKNHMQTRGAAQKSVEPERIETMIVEESEAAAENADAALDYYLDNQED